MEQRNFYISGFKNQVIALALPSRLFSGSITLYNDVFRCMSGEVTVHFLSTSVEPPLCARVGRNVLYQLLSAFHRAQSVTVVGASGATSSVLGLPRNASKYLFQEALKDRFGNSKRQTSFNRIVGFVSPEEYEIAVGHERFALEQSPIRSMSQRRCTSTSKVLS